MDCGSFLTIARPIASGLFTLFHFLHLSLEDLSLALAPLLGFDSPCLANLLQLPLSHHLTLDLALLLGINQGKDGHHTLMVVDKDLALLLAPGRLGDAGGSNHVELGQIEFLVGVDALFLLLCFGHCRRGKSSRDRFCFDLLGWTVRWLGL